MASHRVVSQDEWLKERKEFLKKEKELTHLREELSRKRRDLPWLKVDKSYTFEGPNGKETLADLFGNKTQLAVYHFMFGPEWEEGCPSCSLIADHMNASFVHLAQRDVSLVVVSRAPISKIEAFKKRMGWKFKWVSSHGSDFNFDYNVSFTKEQMKGNYYNFGTSGDPGDEAPGLSVFYRDPNGDIFRTYSTYARGLEELLSVYGYLDLVPKGRDEDSLSFSMAWVHHHDRYPPDRKTDGMQSDLKIIE